MTEQAGRLEQAEADLRDAAALVDRDLSLVSALTGGEHALTQLVTDGSTELVVRSFPVDDPATAREADVLPRLAPLGDRAPRLHAHDPDRTRPLIVTSRVAGGAPPPQASPTALATPLAAMLAEVHALDGRGLPPLSGPRHGSATPLSARARIEWELLATTDPVLSHGDYWCGNATWSGLEVTGLVDWSGACLAPRSFDLSWCRLDLVLLGDPGAADVLVSQYRRLTGETLPDLAAWDRQAAAHAESVVGEWAPKYAGIGRRHLTATRLRQRFDAWSTRLESAT